MRILLFLIATATPAFAGDATADSAPFVGTWNVTATPRGGTCGAGIGTVNAYIWIVGANAPGTLAVSVQGETSFPSLSGQVTGNDVRLIGYGKPDANTLIGTDLLVPTFSFDLTLMPDGGLRGIRVYSGFTSTPRDNGIGTQRTACYTLSDVVAKR